MAIASRADAIGAAAQKILDADRAGDREGDRAAMEAALQLVTIGLIDLGRIADALDQIADHLYPAGGRRR